MDKYFDNSDLRVQRTKSTLIQTFLELLKTKTFQDITVSELAKQAGINRKTFYLHYSSTNDLLEEIQDHVLQRMVEVLGKYNFIAKDFDPYPMFIELNQELQKDFPITKALLFSPTQGITVSKIKKWFINYSLNRYRGVIKFDPIKFEFYLDYTISGYIALYISWISHKPPLISIEELAEIASEISYKGFDEIISGAVNHQ